MHINVVQDVVIKLDIVPNHNNYVFTNIQIMILTPLNILFQVIIISFAIQIPEIVPLDVAHKKDYAPQLNMLADISIMIFKLIHQNIHLQNIIVPTVI